MKNRYSRKHICEALAYWKKQLKQLNESKYTDENVLTEEQIESLTEDDLLDILGISSPDDYLDTEITIWYNTRDVDDFEEADFPAWKYASKEDAERIFTKFYGELINNVYKISVADIKEAFYEYFTSEATLIAKRSGDFPNDYESTGRWPNRKRYQTDALRIFGSCRSAWLSRNAKLDEDYNDPFFSASRCDRCGGSLAGGRTMSMFNTDTICMKCAAKEKKRPDYSKARDAEAAAVRSGDRNFRGIGMNESESYDLEDVYAYIDKQYKLDDEYIDGIEEYYNDYKDDGLTLSEMADAALLYALEQPEPKRWTSDDTAMERWEIERKERGL